jgi:hypothetical protein
MPNFFSSSQDVVNIWDYLSLRFGVVQGLQGLMGPLILPNPIWILSWR